MGELKVDYNEVHDLRQMISGVTSKLESRKAALDNIKRGISYVGTSRSYLGSAVSELYSKEKVIQGKIDKLDKFESDLKDFVEEASDADKRVADRINTTTESFCYSHGIKTKEKKKPWWKKAADFVSDTCEAIGDFYEKNKDAIFATLKVVVKVAFCALAVIAVIAAFPVSGFFAGCLAAAACYELAKSAHDVVTATVACVYEWQGNKAAADKASKWGLGDSMGWLGQKADDATGLKVFEKGANILYNGLEVFSTVVGAVDLVNNLSKIFKLDNDSIKLFKKTTKVTDPVTGRITKQVTQKGIFQRTWAENKTWFKQIDFKNRFSWKGSLYGKTGKSRWISAGKELLGINSMPSYASNDYAGFKDSFKWLTGGNTKATTNLLKFKTYGNNIKAGYDIFDEATSASSFPKGVLSGMGKINCVSKVTGFTSIGDLAKAIVE